MTVTQSILGLDHCLNIKIIFKIIYTTPVSIKPNVNQRSKSDKLSGTLKLYNILYKYLHRYELLYD